MVLWCIRYESYAAVAGLIMTAGGAGVQTCAVIREDAGGHRDLHYPLRRQRQMCIRDRSITIVVTNTNDAPTITSTGGTAVNEDSPYSYSITTADDDRDPGAAWTISCSGAP